MATEIQHKTKGKVPLIIKVSLIIGVQFTVGMNFLNVELKRIASTE